MDTAPKIRNRHARRHPWLIAIGVLAGVAVTLAAGFAILLWYAFRNWSF